MDQTHSASKTSVQQAGRKEREKDKKKQKRKSPLKSKLKPCVLLYSCTTAYTSAANQFRARNVPKQKQKEKKIRISSNQQAVIVPLY